MKKCVPEAEIIETEINSEPAFVKQDVDMVYMGPMPENIQEMAINKLKPYKERIKELINNNVVFLVTGNAIEVFGKYMPIKLEKTWYTHPLSLNLYGLNQTKEAINKKKQAIIFEAE